VAAVAVVVVGSNEVVHRHRRSAEGRGGQLWRGHEATMVDMLRWGDCPQVGLAASNSSSRPRALVLPCMCVEVCVSWVWPKASQ